MNTAEHVKPYKTEKKGKKEQIALMFNKISGSYDFLNHFLSFGIDIVWRRKALKNLKALAPQNVLDVATGTGDFAVEIVKELNPKKVTGVDISEGMLNLGKEKIAKKNLSNQITFELGDSENLPFENDTFDAITVAFGVRNFENLEVGLADMHRVLHPKGKTVILEFSKPKNNWFIRTLYSFYLTKLLPFFGKLVSGEKHAYKYLADSVMAFPDDDDFMKIMRNAGFKNVKHLIKENAKLIDEIRENLVQKFNLNFIRNKLRIINIYNTGQKLNHRLYNISLGKKFTNGFIRNEHDVLEISDRDFIRQNRNFSFTNNSGNKFQNYLIESRLN